MLRNFVQICHYETVVTTGWFEQRKQCLTPSKCYWHLICERKDLEIAVRNCGNFFVYHLPHTKLAILNPTILNLKLKSGVYCSSKTRTNPEG